MVLFTVLRYRQLYVHLGYAISNVRVSYRTARVSCLGLARVWRRQRITPPVQSRLMYLIFHRKIGMVVLRAGRRGQAGIRPMARWMPGLVAGDYRMRARKGNNERPSEWRNGRAMAQGRLVPLHTQVRREGPAL